MNEAEAQIVPTRINLHKKSRLLEIDFADGSGFHYPCEYLRVFAPGADATPVHGKRRVNLARIEAEGETALCLEFDDGFSGSYTWSALHELGVNQQQNWKSYLQQLEENGLERGAGDSKIFIKLLYFIQLAQISGCDHEEVELPPSVDNVEGLLAWLRKRGDAWREAFAADKVQVTVNKQFAEPWTLIEDGDEVALVPRSR
ncbi:MAG: DUF971 domain-containing protein [Thiogranum sp.]|nr:DUF971 domain-containing protein [Thiogranum sp.]